MYCGCQKALKHHCRIKENKMNENDKKFDMMENLRDNIDVDIISDEELHQQQLAAAIKYLNWLRRRAPTKAQVDAHYAQIRRKKRRKKILKWFGDKLFELSELTTEQILIRMLMFAVVAIVVIYSI
jgi:hypothetical protein